MSAPRQILLPLLRRPQPDLATFVAGPNAEALAAVRNLLSPNQSGGLVYLWGDAGSGRSHLLQGFAAGCSGFAATARVVEAATVDGDWLPQGPVLVVDDVDRLAPAAQVRLFDAINRGHRDDWLMLISGPCAPVQLALRGELSSRLAQGLVLHLQHLSDTDKTEAMSAYAAQLGFALPNDVMSYLLRHGRRDLGTLLAVVQAIDEVSLRDQRPVSVRLAHDVLYSADLFCEI